MDTYRTQEQIDQERFSSMPQEMPKDLSWDEVMRSEETPAVIWFRCPKCGGVFAVFSEVNRQRILADVPVPISSTTLVDRTGQPYIQNSTAISAIRCLDCDTTLGELHNDYGFDPFVTQYKAVMRGGAALPPRREFYDGSTQ